MARWPTLAVSLAAVAVLITSTAAPGLLGTVHPQAASSGTSMDALPSYDLAPPSGRAYGLYVSGLTNGGAPLWAESPLAEAETTNGFAEDRSIAAEALVRDPNSGRVLAHVKGVTDYAAARTVVGPDNHNRSIHWASQARAHSTVTYASLLDGAVKARLIYSHVFASASQRSDNLRLEDGLSRIAEVTVLGQVVKVDRTLELPLLNLGVLYVNKTVADPATGTISNYGLWLKLNNGMDIVVSSATVTAIKRPLGEGSGCYTYTESYPVGTKDRVLSESIDGRHNLVMGDPPFGSSRSYGYINNAPVMAAQFVVKADVAGAEQETINGPGGAAAWSRSELAGVDILNGLVLADVLTARSEARITLGADGTPTLEHKAQGVLASVKIRGSSGYTTIEYTTEPNRVYEVRANEKVVAKVVLNEQTTQVSSEGSLHTVIQRTNTIRVLVTGTGLGVPLGTQVVVGHAISLASCGHAGEPKMPPLDFGNPFGPNPI